jgi:mRNA interferase RelE/StbE
MWALDIGDGAKQDIAKLDSQIRIRVLLKLKWFVENFESIKPEPLHHDLKGDDKIKVGDWRIAYEIKHAKKFIFVRAVGHRSEIYKKRK